MPEELDGASVGGEALRDAMNAAALRRRREKKQLPGRRRSDEELETGDGMPPAEG